MTDLPIDAALAADDPWTAIDALAADPPAGPADLAARTAARYERADDDERLKLGHLLGLLGEDGDRALLGLLSHVGTQDLVYLAVRRRLRIPAPTLDVLLGRLGHTKPVVDALGLSGDPGRAALLGALLADDVLCRPAALALARLRAREWTVPIARRLPGVSGLTHVALTVALVEMDDPAAVPHLLDWLADDHDLPAGDVHRALVRLTGHDPLVPEWATQQEYSRRVRRIWPTLDLGRPPVPAVRDLAADSPRGLRFTLDAGRGRVRVDYDPPEPGSSWPRWGKTLHVGPHPLYRVGSDCDTCETTLGLLGFPPAGARTDAADVRETLADLHTLTAGTVRALEPLIHELESGSYRAHLVDLPLEHVTRPERSWWLRRVAARDDPPHSGDAPSWPGTEHFQTPLPLATDPPTYGSILPAQPLDALDPATVARHASAIARDERPTALLLAWSEDRFVEAQWEERFLLGIVLDGHHRLAAYAASSVPARVLMLECIEPRSTLPEILGAL
ncbi:hypothetical protein DSC45_31665 [Streptomyces sp. YIM 130001]|uniref:hypothetical protein n=1 Tax=Streptomyces sp. YIM 130001 TaxID=2259644 RepID=UPI000E64D555|nr:hypothetical protein [Streptomyces sp. YIM 130001]RII09247.1 hypothetical protein DSC45_31665 [Streptomyces sp. YIM 130001]